MPSNFRKGMFSNSWVYNNAYNRLTWMILADNPYNAGKSREDPRENYITYYEKQDKITEENLNEKRNQSIYRRKTINSTWS